MSSRYRHIAVIVAGLDEEYQSSVMQGIIDAAGAHDANIACFSAFGGVLGNSLYDTGEYNIYSLIRFEQFDGAILLSNTIGDIAVREQIIDQVKSAGIPVVVLDNSENPEFYNIRINNTAAMRGIIQHVITEHGAKTLNYISGPLNNPEAKERYQAFLDVLAENRLSSDVRRVYFGEFRPVDGKRAIEELLGSGLPLPDAIISANDAMALEAICVLNRHGIRVPQDVIVTGFDDTYYAQHHSPTLTTVSRPLCDAGKTACEILLQILNGKACSHTTDLAAFPVFNESCGCTPAIPQDMQEYKKSTYNLIKGMRSDISLLNRMTSALAETETAEENIRIIGEFLKELECEKACICLCSDWQSVYRDAETGESSAEYLVHGYTKTMNAPLIWTAGKTESVSVFESADLYPQPLTGGGNVSYFLPLHFRERCLGYYIISNGDFPIRSMLCHSLMMNISHSIENIRKLLHLNNAIRELDRLYVIDPLCNIYNRNGFIRLANRILRECTANGQTLMVAFIDMDGLKYVNDHYGHDEGDFALQRLAAVISNTCTEQQVCTRFGGDEFIILGTNATEPDANALEERFRNNLAEMNRIIGKPYELAASIGTYVTPVTKDMKLFSVISQADQLMYEQKRRNRKSRYLRRD